MDEYFDNEPYETEEVFKSEQLEDEFYEKDTDFGQKRKKDQNRRFCSNKRIKSSAAAIVNEPSHFQSASSPSIVDINHTNLLLNLIDVFFNLSISNVWSILLIPYQDFSKFYLNLIDIFSHEMFKKN